MGTSHQARLFPTCPRCGLISRAAQRPRPALAPPESLCAGSFSASTRTGLWDARQPVPRYFRCVCAGVSARGQPSNLQAEKGRTPSALRAALSTPPRAPAEQKGRRKGALALFCLKQDTHLLQPPRKNRGSWFKNLRTQQPLTRAPPQLLSLCDGTGSCTPGSPGSQAFRLGLDPATGVPGAPLPHRSTDGATSLPPSSRESVPPMSLR